MVTSTARPLLPSRWPLVGWLWLFGARAWAVCISTVMCHQLRMPWYTSDHPAVLLGWYDMKKPADDLLILYCTVSEHGLDRHQVKQHANLPCYAGEGGAAPSGSQGVILPANWAALLRWRQPCRRPHPAAGALLASLHIPLHADICGAGS